MKKSAQKKTRDYYAEIDKALSAYENGKYITHNMRWICDRIAWCWKFRHITESQMEELADRAMEIMPVCGFYDLVK